MGQPRHRRPGAAGVPTPGPEEELVERYHELVGRASASSASSPPRCSPWCWAPAPSGQWESWILFTNSVDFGSETDPLFGKDIGFYVFELPFLSFAVGWLFAALVIILLITIVAHYLNGGIRLQVPGPERVTPQVKAHLSVLLGLLALVRAVDYYLERYELTVSTRGTVDGATYTDVNAQLPATNLLILIALAAAVLFLLNIRRKGWVLPAHGRRHLGDRRRRRRRHRPRRRCSGSGSRRPSRRASGVHRAQHRGHPCRVRPRRRARRSPFEGNADAHRRRPGRQRRRSCATSASGTPASLERDLPVAAGPAAVYQITDVDVDRYMVDGQLTQVMIATRELETSALPQTSWEARHLTFTHGYGVVASPANSKESNGRPDLVVSDVPLQDEIGLDIQRAGHLHRRGPRRLRDREHGPRRDRLPERRGHRVHRVRGRGRRRRRLVPAARRLRPPVRRLQPVVLRQPPRGQPDPLPPRRPRAGVGAGAVPHLRPRPLPGGGRRPGPVGRRRLHHHQPLPVLAAGRVVDGDNDLDQRFNYIRNSVKAVVDAYDGSVTFYIVDDADPIIEAYRRPSRACSPRSHRRRTSSPTSGTRRTCSGCRRTCGAATASPIPTTSSTPSAAGPSPAIPGSGTPDLTVNTTATTTDPNASQSDTDRIEPYYLLTSLPGQDAESFVQLRPFIPIQGDRRPVLTGFLVASSDPETYGQLTSFETPPSNQVDGPTIVAGTIRSFEPVSEDQTQLCREGSGSTCEFGNLVFVPIEQGIIYVQPLYITAEGSNFPVLRKVIVEFNGDVGYADTLREALLQIFDEVPETLEEEGPTEIDEPTDPAEPGDEAEPPSDQTAAQLLEQAEQLFEEADIALRDSDLVTYAEKIEQARGLVDQAADLLGEAVPEEIPAESGEPSATTTTSEPQSA